MRRHRHKHTRIRSEIVPGCLPWWWPDLPDIPEVAEDEEKLEYGELCGGDINEADA